MNIKIKTQITKEWEDKGITNEITVMTFRGTALVPELHGKKETQTKIIIKQAMVEMADRLIKAAGEI